MLLGKQKNFCLLNSPSLAQPTTSPLFSPCPRPPSQRERECHASMRIRSPSSPSKLSSYKIYQRPSFPSFPKFASAQCIFFSLSFFSRPNISQVLEPQHLKTSELYAVQKLLSMAYERLRNCERSVRLPQLRKSLAKPP